MGGQFNVVAACTKQNVVYLNLSRIDFTDGTRTEQHVLMYLLWK